MIATTAVHTSYRYLALILAGDGLKHIVAAGRSG